MSSLLFGDELQSQLAAIRASNRISNTAIDPERGSVSTRCAPSAHEVGDPEILIEKGFFSTTPLSAVDKQEQRRATETTERGKHSRSINSFPNGE